MKNIEKYKETKDALEAFRAWYKDHKHSVLTMSGWLEKEYEAPPPPTLLEAASDAVDALASDVVKGWYKADDTFVEKIIVLRSAIASEKLKPVRNFERYKTADGAYDGFREMCNGMERCEYCRFRDSKSLIRCALVWLYEEAEKEVSK